MIVLVWLMDDLWVRKLIMDGVAGMELDVNSVTLICDQEELVRR